MSERSEVIVYLVDDDKFTRLVLATIIESVGLKVAHCTSAADFFEMHDPNVPGCVISDVFMPVMSGVAMQQRMIEQNIDTPVIFMSGGADISTVARAMKAGAIDFHEKPVDKERLLQNIESAIKHCLDTRVQRQAVVEARCRYAQLTAREREVMQCMLDGMSSKESGRRIGLNGKTVENYRMKVFKKMEVDSLPELVRIGLLLGGSADGNS